VNNQEIADLFTGRIPENSPKDLYDRYLDLAIYINDTSDEDDNIGVINGLADNLELAYSIERI
jgi:hypothetical protein